MAKDSGRPAKGRPGGYGQVTAEIAERIEEICGEENVLFGDPGKLERYSRDQVVEKRYGHAPELVAKPRTAEQIAEILKLANERRVPVTPRGAGSGLSGGAVPLYGGISLSLERMTSVLEIDTENLIAVVEPGVVTRELDTQLAEHDLFFAGYPLSREICYLGGNVAENAGGGRAVKYGVTGRYITGLELVTAAGRIVRFGGKRFKDVTGYSMVALMIGSEGTLGVFTKIWIRLLPRPRHRRELLALFPGVQAAISAVPEILIKGKIVPSAIEFMDAVSFAEGCRSTKESFPIEEGGAALLLEADGAHEAQVRAEMETIEGICARAGARHTYPAETDEEIERLWKIRERIAWALRRLGAHQSAEDIVVPIAAIPRLLEETERLGGKHGISIPNFGHAGDGNMHTTPIKDPDQAEDAWEETLHEVLTELYGIVRDLGGTISGEHGIGHKRRGYMPLVMSRDELDMLRAVKRALDPNNILNPGKIFDPE